MTAVALSRIVRECDRILKPERFSDWERAFNGLQVQNNGFVTRIAAAVDARLGTIRATVEAGADFLLVHHGLFWGENFPYTNARYQLLRLLLDNNLAVYSSHLPLDANPRLGNSAGLCAALGLTRIRPFFKCRGHLIGFMTRTRLLRETLVRRVEQATGHKVEVIPAGPPVCKCIGVVTGSAGTELAQAALEGVDTLVTGEGPYWAASMAELNGINVIYAGHYATETFGVKSLA
ncbi:MAG: Nif3-like dinuclear metal center hexameric protein, partial [Verrucomicrobiae bacterium]|nr:Nif3-like dinuclear metal center hexameric protein [Verrucomicrobiae bacterium]